MKIKKWLLTKLISLCNLALKYQDGADDQNEINNVVNMKNSFIRELKNIS